MYLIHGAFLCLRQRTDPHKPTKILARHSLMSNFMITSQGLVSFLQ